MNSNPCISSQNAMVWATMAFLTLLNSSEAFTANLGRPWICQHRMNCHAIQRPVLTHRPQTSLSGLFVPSWHAEHDDLLAEDPLEQHLQALAHKFKLQLYDWEERTTYGYESKDMAYGVEVMHTDVTTEPSLGLELLEMAHGSDGQGLVLVSGVKGNAASCGIQVGDTITGVSVPGSSFSEKVVAFDYGNTMDVLRRAKHVGVSTIHLETNRLVKRAKVDVTVVGGKDDGPQKIHALAGENLRQLLLRRGIKLYDSKTKRFDMPHATGNCSGDGLCGTCLVKVLEGQESLSPPSDMERLITKGRPNSWRAACRAVVGHENKEGHVRLQLHPQSDHGNQLDPGVRDIHL
jgi:ferredoxin